jgi:hypothetical protein
VCCEEAPILQGIESTLDCEEPTVLASERPVAYVITTTYEDFKVLQARFFDFPTPFIYVFNPVSLLDIVSTPHCLVNMFDLHSVALPEERLWVDGNTYAVAERIISEVVIRLSLRGWTIFSDMEDFLYHYNKRQRT